MFRLDLGKYSTNGGFLSPSLAAILYQTSLGDFVYQTDSNGNVVLDNQGTLTSSYDGLPYSSRFIELGALNDVEFPIHHTLGSDIANQSLSLPSFAADNGATEVIDGLYYKVTATADSLRAFYALWVDLVTTSFIEGNEYQITLTAKTDAVGTVSLSTFGSTHSPLVLSGVDQIFTFNVKDIKDADYIQDNSALLIGESIWIKLDIEVLPVENPNSYLTYYDFTDGLVTLGNSVDGGSSDNLEEIENGNFNTDTIWIKTGESIISDGVAKIISTTGASSSIYQTATKVGRRYKIDYDITFYNGTALPVLIDGTPLSVTIGSNSLVWTSTSTTFQIKTSGILEAHFDNLSVKEILPISTKYTLNTKTVNNVITHTTQWNASDWTKINNNPNLIGKLALETLGATKTIPELDMAMDAGASADSYYMCSENGGAYLVDSRVAYGANVTINGEFTTDTSWTKEAGWAISGGTANSDGTQVVNAAIYQINKVTIGKIYISSFDIVLITAGGVLASVGGDAGETRTAVGTYEEIHKATASTAVGIVGNPDFIGSVDNFTVREATATEIATYASTARTNADLQQKGIQTTAFVTDGAGVPESYSSNLLQFNGDGRYVDTGWNHGGNPFVIELSIPSVNITGVYQQCGGGTALSTEKIAIGIDPLGKSYFQLFSLTLLSASPVSSAFFQMVYDGTTATAYIDGIQQAQGIVTSTSSIYPFMLGVRNENGVLKFPMASPIDHFKIITNDSQIANYDALAEYNKYLA